MPKFRKKPVVIEARQVPAVPINARERQAELKPLADWCQGAILTSALSGHFCIDMHTPEGVMRALPGDWVIKGVQGEFYPCKPHIFAATYEALT